MQPQDLYRLSMISSRLFNCQLALGEFFAQR